LLALCHENIEGVAMALWEPIDGVFWSAPPAAVQMDGEWPYWPVIAVLLVLTVAIRIARQRIEAKRVIAEHEQREWHLRQHITDIGIAATVVYLVVIVALIGGRSGQLLTMPLNEVGDFFAGAFGPVAFLWLVLGFMQQGDELRLSTKALEDQAKELQKSVEHQMALVEATKMQGEVELTKLQMQQDERDRALRASFKITTLAVRLDNPEAAKNSFRISNDGNNASDLAINFDPPIIGWQQLRAQDLKTGEHYESVMGFNPTECAEEGQVSLVYLDIEGTVRHQSFAYSLDKTTGRFEFKRIHDRHS